jgi:hypothetical protein
MQDEHFLGAANELRAAAWFISQKYQVYFPVVQQGGVDFIIQKGTKLQRVQVKTATWVSAPTKKGVGKYLQCRTHTDKMDRIAYDWLFIVYQSEFWLIPAKALDSSNLSLKHSRGNTDNRWLKYHRTF